MAWGFNRQHVAKKVLERHMNDLDRKRASITNKRDENMRNLQRELMNLHAVSTPDLSQVISAGNPLISLRGRHQFQRVNPTTLVLPSPEISHMDGPRLRRQSESLAVAPRRASVAPRTLRTNLTVGGDVEDKTGSAKGRPGMSRLLSRRGTVAQTEGIRFLNAGHREHQDTDTAIRAFSGSANTRPRKASLSSTEQDLKVEQDRGSPKKGVLLQQKYKRRASRKSISYKEQNGVNVSFYNEETGEEFVPSLKLKDSQDVDHSSDEHRSARGDELEGTVWKEVAKCRYIRGYNPPEMREPETDHATFVFGRNYNDVIEAQRRKASVDQV